LHPVCPKPPPLIKGATPMSPKESEFCRRQAERLQSLAKECTDPELRDQISAIAKEWADRAAAKAA
jgi:hypothetical protein